MASRNTSARVPAQWAATASTKLQTSGVRTRSGLTTRSIGWSRPEWTEESVRATMNPLCRAPASLTVTRTPG
jgi:hypothetical protein